MDLKMMLIALFAALVAVSATSLHARETVLDRLVPLDTKEDVMSMDYDEPMEEEEEEGEEPRYQELLNEEEELKYQELLNEEMKFTPITENHGNNAEVMVYNTVQKAEKLKDFVHKVYGTGHRPVTQGSTIALQRVYDKNTYLWCGHFDRCTAQLCPGLYMDGDDWTKCKAMVFQIYRKDGAGSIHVGDWVGLYYPPSTSWFSGGNVGHTHHKRCAGKPTITSGFETREKWHLCMGEVLQIYAKGKSNGDVINENDHIFLYSMHHNQYVTLVGKPLERASSLSTCPGPVRPPPVDKYDRCYTEVFEIWKQ